MWGLFLPLWNVFSVFEAWKHWKIAFFAKVSFEKREFLGKKHQYFMVQNISPQNGKSNLLGYPHVVCVPANGGLN